MVKNRLEHCVFCFDILSLLLFPRFIKDWINGAKLDHANFANFGFFSIEVSPQIIEPPINQSVTEGNSVNFSCRASGVPTPTLVWVFNNADLPSGINQFNHEGESFLEFLSVTKGMEGTYKCKAKNKANTSISFATLRVYGKFDDNDNNDDGNTDRDDDADDNHGDDDDMTLTLNCY